MSGSDVPIPGYLYLIAEFENGKAGPWTKVGMTISEQGWRINNLRQGNPRELLFVSAFKFGTREKAAAAEYALIYEHSTLISPYRPDWVQKPWTAIEARCFQFGYEKAAIGNLISN